MPLISTEENATVGGSSFGYSATKIDHLEEVGATEYTLATLVVDVSGSVSPFKDEMEGAIAAAFESWKKHPRSDYLLVRLITFNDNVTEIHGFRLLADCDLNDYRGCLLTSGMTALYDAVIAGVDPAVDYAKNLTASDFLVNAITVTITDGADNRSQRTAQGVKEALDAAMQSEVLESHVGILIGVGVGADPSVRGYLAHFETEASFSQYVELADADPDTLAKLGRFMAASVSSQSASLGTGGASQPLTF